MLTVMLKHAACSHGFLFLTSLQLNLLGFLSELLCWFEVRRPEFVQPLDNSGNHYKIVCLCHSVEQNLTVGILSFLFFLDGSTPLTPSSLTVNRYCSLLYVLMCICFFLYYN